MEQHDSNQSQQQTTPEEEAQTDVDIAAADDAEVEAGDPEEAAAEPAPSVLLNFCAKSTPTPGLALADLVLHGNNLELEEGTKF